MIAPACVRCLLFAVLISLLSVGSAQAQTADAEKPAQEDPLTRPREGKKTKKMEKAYQSWVENDVADIITPEELAAFKKLSNDSERDHFIEIFWQRRDPTPDTEENEFKEEHYRRIAYANEHFAAGVPGSKTDRGRVYIIHGQPDSIDAHPAGGPYQRTPQEGGGQTSTFPFEVWRYRNIDNIGQEVEIEFVDTCMCGAYHITMDPDEKDALAKIPNAGLKTNELTGQSSKAQRGFLPFGPQAKQFDVIERNALVLAPPPVKYKDLKEVVDIHFSYKLLPFASRIDFLKGSPDTTLVPITIKVSNSDLMYVGKDGVQHASVNIYGRVTSLSGKIVATFEDPLRLDVPADALEKFSGKVSLYQQALPLRPGRYRLDVVLKDVNSGKLGTLYQSMMVPDFSKETDLTSSSLILADVIEPVLARDTGTGTFVIGPNRVRPRVPAADSGSVVFTRGEKINLWMQVYNLSVDKKFGLPSAKATYRVVNTATNQTVYEHEVLDLTPDLGAGVTLKELLSPGKLEPGTYQVTVDVYDLVSKQTLSPTAKFMVQ